MIVNSITVNSWLPSRFVCCGFLAAECDSEISGAFEAGAYACRASGGDVGVVQQVIDAVLCSSADLLVSDGVADTDVHKFNNLAQFQAFKRKCE